MQPGYSSYDQLMATHRRRIETARASAVAAGLGNRPRRGLGTFGALRRLAPHRPGTVQAGHNPETLFFA